MTTNLLEFFDPQTDPEPNDTFTLRVPPAIQSKDGRSWLPMAAAYPHELHVSFPPEPEHRISVLLNS